MSPHQSTPTMPDDALPGRTRRCVWIVVGLLSGLGVGEFVCGQHHDRWMWWFTSPNDMGPLAAGCAAAALAACAGTAARPAWTWRVFSVLMGLLALAGLTGTIGAVSRAGIIVLVVCSLIVWRCLPRGRRHWAQAWLVMVGAALCWDPQTSLRAATMMTQATSDASIVHRSEIWGASLAMLSDVPRPLTGATFVDIYTRWYEPVPRRAIVWHPLNDTLLVAADYGWAWAAGYAALIGSVTCAAVVAAARSRHLVTIAAACGMVAVGMGGMTSALLRSSGAGWWVAAILTAAVSHLALSHRQRPVARAVVIGGLLGLLAVAGAAGVGLMRAHAWPVRADPDAPRTVVWPRTNDPNAKPPRAVVVVADPQDLTGYGRSLARPLAAAGFRVELRHSSDPGDEPVDVLVMTRGVDGWTDGLRTRGTAAAAIVLLDPLPGLRDTCPGPRGLIIGNRSADAEPTWDLERLPVPRIWAEQASDAVPMLVAWLRTAQARIPAR
jgi:hypothetical protein